jgi:uncharacterized SAM-binding protein YcdF (DUF218 family)
MDASIEMDASRTGNVDFLQRWPKPFIRLAQALKVIAWLMIVGAIAFVIGFVLFVHLIEVKPNDDVGAADGIVVFTGGDERISEGLKLLAKGKASRLLISGVNHGTGRRQLSALYPERGNLFQCCVDLGWKARNTIGNAAETQNWANRRGVNSIIMVTSETHMPRSLLETRRLVPGVTLIPYSVRSPNVEIEEWWMRRHTVRVILTEYIKFIPSLGRCFIDQMTTPDDTLGVRGACLDFAFKF